MIYDENVFFVVMLTNCVDKYGKKCEKYWPELHDTIQYGDITINNPTEIQKKDYVIRFFKMIDVSAVK